jgi:uncharacterized membrane protein YraQ (UPF0718 family)
MAIIDEIEKLRLDARFGKDKHFAAADRTRAYHYWFGVPVIGISVFLGSAVFADLTGELYQKIIGAILAYISALLVSLQTFLNPKEMEKGHRSIGNRYLEISRTCRLISAKLEDQILTLKQVTEEYEKLLSAYNETNIEAEAFPISRADFRNAVKSSQTKIT